MSTEPPKPAPPKRSLKEDKGDDDDAKSAPPPKAGLFPTGLSRAIVLSTIFIGFVVLIPLLLTHRYSLVAAQRSDNAIVYRIDSLTGRVSICSAGACTPVPEKDNGG